MLCQQKGQTTPPRLLHTPSTLTLTLGQNNYLLIIKGWWLALAGDNRVAQSVVMSRKAAARTPLGTVAPGVPPAPGTAGSRCGGDRILCHPRPTWGVTPRSASPGRWAGREKPAPAPGHKPSTFSRSSVAPGAVTGMIVCLFPSQNHFPDRNHALMLNWRWCELSFAALLH